MRRLQLELVQFLDPTRFRAERKLGQVCSKEQYDKVFERLKKLPSRVEHLIIQLGDATSITATPSETECLHRDSDCLSSYGVFGERIIIKTQSFHVLGEVGIYQWFERVCEQI